MTSKQWSVWLLAAGIASLLTVVSIDFESDNNETGISFISLANMTEAQKDSVVRAEISRAKIGDEIISLRSECGKVHKGDDNKLVATIGTKRQHYLDPDDSVYRPIDITVKEISALAKSNPLKKFDEYVDAGVYRATWLKDKPHDYTFYRDDSYVKFTFISSLTNIDVKNEFTVDGVKQTYIIKETPEHNILQWLVETDGNLVADGAGGFKVETSDSAPMLIMPPVAFDAAGNLVIVSASVTGDTLTYWVTVEMEQEYPIKVDPSIIIGETDINSVRVYSQDNVYENARNKTSADYMNEYTNLYVGQAIPGPYDVYRSTLEFNTSSISASAMVDSAKVVVVIAYDYSNTDFNIQLAAATFSGSPNASWYNDFVGWQSSGVYSPIDLATAINTSGKSVGDSLRFTLNAAGKDSINCGGTTRFFLISSRDVSSTAPSGNESVYLENASPYIQVWYTLPPNAPTNFVLSNPTTSTLDASWTNNSSTDIDSLSIYTSAGEWVKTVDKIAPINETTTTIEGLSPNTQYIYKVRADSSTAYSVSDSDTLHTLANPPNAWAFTGASTTSIAPAFGGNSNPGGTLYAIRDSTRSKWISATGDSTSTKTWRTEAQWEAITITGLSINSQYLFGVVGKNGDGVETAYLWGAVYTLAAVPGLPALTAISPFSIHFIIDPEDNPSYTQYALQDSITGLYIDGSAEPETLRVGSPGDWGWKTFSQWGGVEGDTLTGLLPDSLYVIRVKARTGE